MKNFLPIGLFLILFFTDFLTLKLKWLPNAFTWLPEAFISLILVVVVARIINNRSLLIPIKYLILFMVFLYVVVSGIFINEITSLTIVSGIRTYFKYIPLFLLPLAYNYSLNDLKKQLLILIVLGIIQLPVTIWQRFFEYRHLFTGDNITGTLSISNSLSIMLISIIVIILALYIGKKLSLKLMLFLSILLFIPTGLNETKVTIFLLPIGLVALLISMRNYLSAKQIGAISAGFSSLIVIFVISYNILYVTEDELGMSSSESSNRILSTYNFQGYKVDPSVVFDVEENITGEHKYLPEYRHYVGRFDSILMPIEVFWRNDIIRFLFGFGIGNTSSSIGEGGEYTHIYDLGGSATSLSQLMWETGALGALAFIIFILLIAKDAYVVSRNDVSWAIFSAGWFGIALIQFIALAYNNFFHFDEIACIFIFYSSIIAIKRFTMNSVKKS